MAAIRFDFNTSYWTWYREIDVIGTAIGDATAPAITTFSPADNATNVTVGANLVATFNELIAIGTGNITIKNLTDNTQSTIDITSGSPQVTVAGSVLTINPSADLTGAKDYAIQIDAGAITDLTGNPFGGIADDTTWNFATDGTPPTIVTLSPADNATGVAVGANLVVTFNETIAVGTGNITIRNLTDDTQSTIDITSGSPQVTVSGGRADDQSRGGSSCRARIMPSRSTRPPSRTSRATSSRESPTIPPGTSPPQRVWPH